MILWRVATETRSFRADDLGGTGAALRPGRWNEARQPVVHASTTIALAMLETVAHLEDEGLPLNRFLVRIDVPAAVWAKHEALDTSALPAAWNAIPAGRASIDAGTQWLRSLRSPVLLVPSVIVPEERNALINPLHPMAPRIRARAIRRIEYNRVFRALERTALA